MSELYNIWTSILDFFAEISWGSVLTYMGTGAAICFGIDRLILSHRKPKAELSFSDGKKEMAVNPYYVNKRSVLYYIPHSPNVGDFMRYEDLLRTIGEEAKNHNLFLLKFRLSNVGKLQLENYRVEIDRGKGISTICKPLNLVEFITKNDTKPTDLNIFSKENPNAVYAPVDKLPLNQHDHRDFQFHICPDPNANKAELYWKIIAKDFYKDGKLVIRLKQQLMEYDDIKMVYSDVDIPKGAEKIEDLTPVIDHLEGLLEEFE